MMGGGYNFGQKRAGGLWVIAVVVLVIYGGMGLAILIRHCHK